MAYAKTTRGRPPRFSREAIVEAVTAMVLADPQAPVTVSRAAAAVGARPMTLYRHFADRDDLVSAVIDAVFAETRRPLDPALTWQDQVCAWMTSVYDRARRVPQLVHVMASGESGEWVASSAYLAGIFEAAGVTDDDVRAEAVYWVAMTTMGHALIDAGGHGLDDDALATSVRRLETADAARITALLPHLSRVRARGFGLVVDRTLEQVERLLAAPAVPPT